MRHTLEISHRLSPPEPGDGTQPWTQFFDRAALLATTAHTAALLRDPNAADYATRAVDALTAPKVKARAVVLAEAALATAHVGEYKLCLDYGSEAARLAHDLESSLAAALLREVAAIVLPESHIPAVRKLLPHLATAGGAAGAECENTHNHEGTSTCTPEEANEQ
jgi:ATP/maltotriose-dependent transcriptional regulator MalT